MKSSVKEVARTIGITVAICMAATILMVIFGGGRLVIANPFIKGYLHLGLEHFATNIIILSLTLLSPVNRSYDFKKIYIVTVVISLIYLPFELLGLSQTALGLSGTCYFLLSRYFFSWRERSRLGMLIISVLALLELGASVNTSIDKTAHFVHVLGIVLGYLSLKYAHKKSLEKLGF
jgi:hypothetical protein